VPAFRPTAADLPHHHRVPTRWTDNAICYQFGHSSVTCETGLSIPVSIRAALAQLVRPG